MRAVLTLMMILIAGVPAGAAEQCGERGGVRACVTTFAAFTATRFVDSSGRVTAVEFDMPDVDRPGAVFVATIGAMMAALAPASSADQRRDVLAGIMRQAERGDRAGVQLGRYRWRASKAGRALKIEADYWPSG
jgi:hypothetical protein